jgi:transposase, IS5 family
MRLSELESAARKKRTRAERVPPDRSGDALRVAGRADRAVLPQGRGTWPAADRTGTHAAHVHRPAVLRPVRRGTEDALYDSQAIRSFVGIDLSREAVPDATTLLKFRRLLEAQQDLIRTYLRGDQRVIWRNRV